jgi:hypothetical protein
VSPGEDTGGSDQAPTQDLGGAAPDFGQESAGS